MRPKFKIGEVVKIVKHGWGISSTGVGDTVTITDNTGQYKTANKNSVGYAFVESGNYPKYTHNGNTGRYSGYCGEPSFERICEDVPLKITKDE